MWVGIVVGYLVLAIGGPVAMVRESRPAGQAAAAPAGAAAAAAAPVVSMENIAFAPETLTVRPGTEVLFENRDVAPHTVTAADIGVDSGTINPGKSFKLVVTQPLDYICTIHPSMKAKILLSG